MPAATGSAGMAAVGYSEVEERYALTAGYPAQMGALCIHWGSAVPDIPCRYPMPNLQHSFILSRSYCDPPCACTLFRLSTMQARLNDNCVVWSVGTTASDGLFKSKTVTAGFLFREITDRASRAVRPNPCLTRCTEYGASQRPAWLAAQLCTVCSARRRQTSRLR